MRVMRMKATLTATFERGIDGKTVAHVRQEPPLTANWTVDRDGTVVLYTSNQAGLALGGDEYTYDFRVCAGAHAVITGVSASKYGPQRRAAAVERTALRVEGNGILEWIPELQILFADADVQQHLDVEMDTESRLILFSIQAVGRVASGERHLYHRWRQRTSVRQSGRPAFVESWDLRPQDTGVEIDVLTEGYSYAGLGYIAGPEHDAFGELGNATATMLKATENDASPPPFIGGVTINAVGHLVIRWLAASAADSRRLMMEAWTLARHALLGQDPPHLGKY